MTKQELYRDLCVEGGTYTGGEMSDQWWYDECSHNISSELDASLQSAAEGDVAELAECRRQCGLPAVV